MKTIVQISKKSKVRFPVSLTEAALSRVIDIRNQDDELDDSFFVRVACKGGGCSGMLFSLDFDNRSLDGDLTNSFELDGEKIDVVVDSRSSENLEGLTIDYVRSRFSEEFKFLGGDKIKRTCGCGASFSV